MKRRYTLAILAVFFCISGFSQSPSGSLTPGTTSNPTDPDRIKALELYAQNRMPEAVPLLVSVIERYPTDVVAHEKLGVALISKSDVDTDPEQAKADLIRAREELLKAQGLGDNSDLLHTLLEILPEHGERAAFSAKAGADSAMHRGEAAFGQGKFDDALREYAVAYELDPTLYLAALDMGDVYFRLRQIDKSGEWFTRAIEINPNGEAAYRYWGDALLQQGNLKEARSKYIEGIAAFPYSNHSWVGIRNWLAFTHLSFNQLNFPIPSSVTQNSTGGVNITLDPSTLAKDDGGSAWMMYGMERALWRQEKFAKEFPGEKTYRHSLKEEVESLSMAATSYAGQKKDGRVKHSAQELDLLSHLQADDLLDPYVLLVRPDKDIAQDFAAYQQAHRDKLIVFLDKYLVPQAPESGSALTKVK